MTRLYVIVEGQSEEAFVEDVLAPVLWAADVYPTAIVIGPPGHRGGRVTFDRVVDHLARLLKQEADVHCTTLLDFYGRGRGFPTIPAGLSPHAAAELLERAIKDKLLADLPNHRVDARCHPYFQLHEFEALLSSDTDLFATTIGRPDLSGDFASIRGAVATPEEINDDPTTAPSKRVLAAHPRYRKVIDGRNAAAAIGIARMRRECPRFDNWIGRLEALRSA